MNTITCNPPEASPVTMAELVRNILVNLGENPDREGLTKTPHRVSKSLREMTAGYHVDIDRLINNALFTVPYSEMVVVKDIDFYSLCEHHMLPFFGKCHVAYVPDGKVIGLSKIPRIVEVFSRRLQVQERLTSQIAEIIQKKINPLGVAVVMEGRHLCMEMRGAQSKGSVSIFPPILHLTSSFIKRWPVSAWEKHEDLSTGTFLYATCM